MNGNEKQKEKTKTHLSMNAKHGKWFSFNLMHNHINDFLKCDAPSYTLDDIDLWGRKRWHSYIYEANIRGSVEALFHTAFVWILNATDKMFTRGNYGIWLNVKEKYITIISIIIICIKRAVDSSRGEQFLVIWAMMKVSQIPVTSCQINFLNIQHIGNWCSGSVNVR